MGEASKTIALPIRALDPRQSGEGSPSHSIALCDFAIRWEQQRV